MISQDILQTLQCGLSNDDHILMQPVSLSCGHSVCKKCIPLNFNYDGVETGCGTIHNEQINKCKLCGKQNTINLNQMNESQPVKQLLKLYLNDLFQMLEERFDESIKSLKGI